MTLLTDKQREEVVEAMARGICQYEGVEPDADSGECASLEWQTHRALCRAALTAALPAIERAVLEKLSDPVFVRLNILSGGIARPDDLVWLHDTDGPVAAKVREAERAVLDRVENGWKCDGTGLAGEVG